MTSDTIELKLLVGAAIIGMLHLLWASVAGSGGNRDTAWLLGPRDDPRPVTGQAARLSRAYANFLETFPLFAAVLISALMAGKQGTLTHFGAWLYVIARVAYTPFYALGLPVIRTIAWAASVTGIVMVIIAFFQ